MTPAARCGTPITGINPAYSATCTQPAGHDGPHAGPLLHHGRQVGGAAWDPPPGPATPPAPDA